MLATGDLPCMDGADLTSKGVSWTRSLLSSRYRVCEFSTPAIWAGPKLSSLSTTKRTFWGEPGVCGLDVCRSDVLLSDFCSAFLVAKMAPINECSCTVLLRKAAMFARRLRLSGGLAEASWERVQWHLDTLNSAITLPFFYEDEPLTKSGMTTDRGQASDPVNLRTAWIEAVHQAIARYFSMLTIKMLSWWWGLPSYS